MIRELHVIVSRTPDGAFVSTISGIPALKVSAESMEALRARTLELVRENLESLESLEGGMGSGLEVSDLPGDE